MQRKFISIYSLIVMLLLAAGNTSIVNAAETNLGIQKEKETRVYNPCDEILYPGEYLRFSVPNSGGPSWRVDAIDVANDKVYNSALDAWLPSYSLVEAYASGYGDYPLDQILYVGEYFYVDGNFAQLNKTGFYIYDVTSTKAKIKLKDKYNNDIYVWVNVAPIYEYNPNGYC